MQGLTVADLLLLCVVLLSMIWGGVRGLLFEILSLLGWVVALVAAMVFWPDLGEITGLSSPWVLKVLSFLVTLTLWSLGARLLRMVLHATPLSVIDRLLGAVFGLLRGVIVVLLLVWLVNLSRWGHEPAWRQSITARWVQSLEQWWSPPPVLEISSL